MYINNITIKINITIFYNTPEKNYSYTCYDEKTLIDFLNWINEKNYKITNIEYNYSV